MNEENHMINGNPDSATLSNEVEVAQDALFNEQLDCLFMGGDLDESYSELYTSSGSSWYRRDLCEEAVDILGSDNEIMFNLLASDTPDAEKLRLLSELVDSVKEIVKDKR